MIRLTRLNHAPIVLNADLIQLIESTPDTVVTLTNGQKVMVRESACHVVDLVVAYRRSILLPATGPAPVEQALISGPGKGAQAHGQD